ncbi:AAA family ATPase [Streptomyces sp. NPDC054796]
MTTPPTAPATSPRPQEPAGYDYGRLAGARAILTQASEETYANLVTTMNAHNGRGALMCVHGGVGLGKTFAVNLHLDELAPHTTIRIEAVSSDRQPLRDHLYSKLDLHELAPAQRNHWEAVKEAFSATPRVLVVDEAQKLKTRDFEFLRELWDAHETRVAIVLVGAESCYQKIKHRPALASRILVWQRYKPLTPDEVLTVIPHYHPLWAEVPAQDLLWVDDLACHGNFRQWAKITYLMQENASTSAPSSPSPDPPDAPEPPSHSPYSRDLVRAVLSRIDPTQRPNY